MQLLKYKIWQVMEIIIHKKKQNVTTLAIVTSSQFSGKSKIEQHKMVYNSLKGRMGNELHALAIKTKES